MKVHFLIRSLQRGGAERQCVVLARGLRTSGHDVEVLVFYPGGDFYQELLDAKIPVESLEKRYRWDCFGFMWRLCSYVRKERPHVLYSWLTVPNIIALGVKMFVPHVRVIWGLRTGSMELKYYDGLVQFSYWLESRLSRFADGIIVNSEAGFRDGKAGGYNTDRMVVIPNGIDAETFVTDRSRGKALRTQWGVDDDGVLIGLVGRLDPIKDHPTFLRAAAQVAGSFPAVKFVCIGDGESSYKASLHRLTKELGLSSRLVWAGECQDMPAAYNAVDVACLTSIAEGFPNVVLEAMACGKLCVVTDVGDAARIVGDSGYVVPVGDPEALTVAWMAALNASSEEKKTRGLKARQRVIEHFSLERLIKETGHVLEKVRSR